MRTLTLEALQAVFAQDTGEVFVFGIRVYHPDWLEDVYLVADSDDMEFEGNTYKAFTFTIPMLPQQESTIPTVTLKIDNITLELMEFLRSVESNIKVDLSLFRRSGNGDVSREIGAMVLSGAGFTANASTVSITLTMSVDYLNEPACKDRFTPTTAPGLF